MYDKDIYQKSKDFTALTILFVVSFVCAIFCFLIYFKYPDAGFVLKIIFWILFLILFCAGGLASVNLLITGLDAKNPFFSIFGLLMSIAYIVVIILFLTIAI